MSSRITPSSHIYGYESCFTGRIGYNIKNVPVISFPAKNNSLPVEVMGVFIEN
jgi:hypothetical protein